MKGSGGIEQPVHGLPQRGHRRPPVGDLPFGVGHCTRQHVQLVVQRVEFGTGHDQFVLTDLKFSGSLTSDPIPLTARLTAELLRPTGSGPLGHDAAAVTASRSVDRPPPSPYGRFRHDEIMLGQVTRRADARNEQTVDMSTPPAPERRFASDNNASVHPKVLEALIEANSGHAVAYGDDPWTQAAARRFDDLFGRHVESLMVWGGTGANVLALASLLSPAGAVVCTDASHINLDETGAPEFVLGAKLLDVPHTAGKISPEQVSEFAHFTGVVHHVQPSVLSITQSTEWGTLYTPDEIAVLADTAHRMGMKVHLDGARIANACAALGGTVDALRSFTVDAGVDVVSFGGAKNGAMYGEAVVFLDPSLAASAPYVRKQITQLPSKMRYVSAQFLALFTDDLWIDNARRANESCRVLHDSLDGIPGVDRGPAPAVNSIFPTLDPTLREAVRAWSFFYDWELPQVRWMTAWDTEAADIEQFASGLRHFASRL